MKRQEGGPVKDASGIFWQKNENNKGIIFLIFLWRATIKNYQKPVNFNCVIVSYVKIDFSL